MKNVGDVKVNVTKTKEGGFVGYIILEPDESEKIDRSGNQDTPVKPGQQDFLGTNQSGHRDKPRPENLSV